jgi:hypothetical protein
MYSLLSHYTSTCFRLSSSPSSGGNNVYMRQLVHVVDLSQLSTGLDGMEHSIPMYKMYQLSHIYIITS